MLKKPKVIYLYKNLIKWVYLLGQDLDYLGKY